jgi:hypothetical protein
MKLLYYLKYFYFIARNWNVRLAAFTVYHEIRGEKKYHLDTIKIDRLLHRNVVGDNLQHASIYQATNYFLLEKAFDYLKSENANNHLVDFGSGKGRTIVVAAHYSFKRITGIDFSYTLCNEAEENIEKIKPAYPHTIFNIICDDAVNYSIQNDDDVFFFFNPFDETVMLRVVKNILASLKRFHRKIYIVYINPLHKEIFLSAGFEEEYYFRKMEYLEFVILSKEESSMQKDAGQ